MDNKTEQHSSLAFNVSNFYHNKILHLIQHILQHESISYY